MHEINKARHSVEKGADRASKTLDSFKDQATTLIEDAQEKGAELIDEARDRSGELLEEAKGYGKDAWGDVKVWVKKNPGPAIGIALAAGFILSAFCRGGSED